MTVETIGKARFTPGQDVALAIDAATSATSLEMVYEMATSRPVSI